MDPRSPGPRRDLCFQNISIDPPGQPRPSVAKVPGAPGALENISGVVGPMPLHILQLFPGSRNHSNSGHRGSPPLLRIGVRALRNGECTSPNRSAHSPNRSAHSPTRYLIFWQGSRGLPFARPLPARLEGYVLFIFYPPPTQPGKQLQLLGGEAHYTSWIFFLGPRAPRTPDHPGSPLAWTAEGPLLSEHFYRPAGSAEILGCQGPGSPRGPGKHFRSCFPAPLCLRIP
jgi:hypothetical protein